MTTDKTLIIFVDVDDTFVRSFGTKRIPIRATIEHLKAIKSKGADLYCWSSGGAEYARSSAKEFGIEDIFTAFLPKPHVFIDDMEISEWRNSLQMHPNRCINMTPDDYAEKLKWK